MLAKFLEEDFISLCQTDEAVFVFKSLRRVAQGYRRDDSTSNQDECAEADEVEEGGLHGQIMPQRGDPAYSCGYAKPLRENQWGYAPSEAKPQTFETTAGPG